MRTRWCQQSFLHYTCGKTSHMGIPSSFWFSPVACFLFHLLKLFFPSSCDGAAFTAGMGDVIVFTLVWWHSSLNQECWEWGLCWIMHSAVNSVVSKELAALVLSAGKMCWGCTFFPLQPSHLALFSVIFLREAVKKLRNQQSRELDQVVSVWMPILSGCPSCKIFTSAASVQGCRKTLYIS